MSVQQPPNPPSQTPARAPASGWRVEQRSGSGTYIISERGALLGRLDRASGVMWMWDKKLGGEVPVKLTDLLAVCQAALTLP